MYIKFSCNPLLTSCSSRFQQCLECLLAHWDAKSISFFGHRFIPVSIQLAPHRYHPLRCLLRPSELLESPTLVLQQDSYPLIPHA